jgi:hypothetical protein
VNYDDLIDDVSVDDVVLLDNGLMQVRVLEKGDNRIRTAVLTSGTLASRRHINLPGVHVNLPALTEKDLADVALGVELGVDFVALSFARKKEDLEELRQVLQKSGSAAEVLEGFLRAQEMIRAVLLENAGLDLNRIRFRNPFIGFLRFTVGAGLLIIAAHDRRHLWQAGRVREAAGFPAPETQIQSATPH